MGKKARIKRERAAAGPRPQRAARVRPDGIKPPTFLTAHAVEAGMSEAEREAVFYKVAQHLVEYMDKLGGIDYAEAHLIAYNVLDSIEARMRVDGIRIPTYSRKLGGQTRADEGNFTYCNRCTMREWHEGKGAWVCPHTYVGPTKATACMFEPANGDGCTRGYPRKEYRS